MIYTSYRNVQKEPTQDDTVIDRSGIWAVIIDSENRILISHPEYDSDIMELPGGGIEENEDKQLSLIREIEEEAGTTFQTLTPAQTFTQHVKFLAWDKSEFWNYDQEYWLVKLENNNHYFEGTRPTEEGALGKWVSLSEINNDNFHHTHFQAMKKMEIINA
ncbi:MAG: NUDIX domain-containing protein [Bdellovibrionales bacterium]